MKFERASNTECPIRARFNDDVETVMGLIRSSNKIIQRRQPPAPKLSLQPPKIGKKNRGKARNERGIQIFEKPNPSKRRTIISNIRRVYLAPVFIFTFSALLS